MKLISALSFLFIFNTAQAIPTLDGIDPNGNIGLEKEPTAGRMTKNKEMEMVLGAIYGIEERFSLSPGAEELINRNAQGNNNSKKRSQRSSN